MLAMLLAQTEETITFDPEAAEAVGVAAAGLAGVMIFVWIAVVIAALLGLILWVWAIIDISKRQFTDPGNKTTWLIVLIVGLIIGLSLIAAIIYLIVGRKQGTIPGAERQAPTSSNEPSA